MTCPPHLSLAMLWLLQQINDWALSRQEQKEKKTRIFLNEVMIMKQSGAFKEGWKPDVNQVATLQAATTQLFRRNCFGALIQQPIKCLLTKCSHVEPDGSGSDRPHSTNLTDNLGSCRRGFTCQLTSHFQQCNTICYHTHLWLSCEPRRLDMVSSKFWRRSRTFCTVRFLWDSGSAGQPGGKKRL